LSIYVDSSFVVSIYISDAHSLEADRRLGKHRGPWLTPLHVSEFVHAVEQSVFRGRISALESQELYLNFEQDCRIGVWTRIDLPEKTFELAIHLARAHVARIGTRTLDTLHVASALELSAQQFWTFDDRQKKLAKAAGLKVS
jgi:predicted nucleic acid-binding protein